MVLTPEQIREKYNISNTQQSSRQDEVTKKLRERNAKLMAKERTRVEKNKNKGGFLGNLVKDIVSPVTEFGVSAVNLGESVFDLARGDVEGAQEALQKERDIPFLGETAPALTGQETAGKMAKKISGYGAEIGSLFFGGGAAGAVGKQTLKGATLQGLKEGARLGSISGAFGLGGREAQQEDSGVEDVLLYSALGGLSGGALGGLIGGASPSVTKYIRKKIKPVAQKVSDELNQAIDKGIKPYFGSTASKSVRDRYYRDAQKAFTTIHKYKPEITDADQGVKISKLPTNRREMLEALEATKKQIFKQYDDLAQSAGNAGVRFDSTDVVSELQSVTQNKSYSPGVRNYAEKMIDEIAELQGETPSVVQNRIQELNSSLKSFFAGRTDRAKAQVDASIASKMRSVLDDLIESSGDGYQVLRSQYSALKTIEKDLARQVALEARKNSKGLLDMTDIFTGSDLLTGFVTGDPSGVVSGMTGRGIKEYVKYINDPNRYIRKGFEVLDNPPADVQSVLKAINQKVKEFVPEGAKDLSKKLPKDLGEPK